MNEKMISIIVPCYNVGQTLKKCLDSILAQSMQNFEVLIVDDGSTDQTKELILQYSHIDNRIIPLYGNHQGVSVARNIGISYARAPYICFVDADDILLPRSLELRLQCIETHPKVDLVIGGFETNDNRLYTGADIKGEQEIDEAKKHLSKHIVSFYYGVVWNKLFRTSIIKEHYLSFSKGIVWAEDSLFVLEYLKYVKNIYYLDQNIYYYLFLAKDVKHDFQSYWHIKMIQMEEFRKLLCTDKSYRICQQNFCNYIYSVLNSELSMVFERRESLAWKKVRFGMIIQEVKTLNDSICTYDVSYENKVVALLHLMMKYRWKKRLFAIYFIKNVLRHMFGIEQYYQKKKRQPPFE